MGRRSDHSREQLEQMIVAEGHRQLSDVGFHRFSAREVAKRVGYSIGTIYNVFGDLDRLMIAINGVTLDQFQAYLVERLQGKRKNRLAVLAEAYFEFAKTHRQAWSAIYDHRMPHAMQLPDSQAERLAKLIGLIRAEVAACLPPSRAGEAPRLALSLLACVHGHCALTIDGTLGLLGEKDPIAAVTARMAEAIAAASAGSLDATA